MNQAFSLVVNNDPRILTRISRVFARSGHNILSLTLKQEEIREISNMEIMTVCTENEAMLIMNQLRKLIDVLQVNKI